MRGSAGWHVREKLRAAEKLVEGKMSFRIEKITKEYIDASNETPSHGQRNTEKAWVAIFQAPDLLLL